MASISYKDPTTGQFTPIVGPPGKSAYDSAVEGGYKGTKEEFYKLLATIGNVSNPNLLINQDFKINQRGQTEYTAAGYTVDRWKITLAGPNTISVQPISAGLKISSNELGCRLQQTLESPETYSAKTLTFTISLSSDCTGLFHMWIFGQAPTDSGSTTYAYKTFKNVKANTPISITATLPDDNRFLAAQFMVESGIAIPRFAKMELGDRFTGFYPTDPATELAKCQRYLFAPWRTGGLQGYTGYVQSNGGGNKSYGMIYTPVTLRAMPSIALGPTGLKYWGTVGGALGTSSLVTSAQVFGYTNNGAQIEFFLNNTLSSGDSGLIYTDTPGPGTLLLDCEIY